MASIGLGFRAMRGGSVVVGVSIADREPRLILSAFLATAAEGDRIAFEPYHLAAEKIAEGLAEAEAIVAEGRARQAKLAAEGLGDLIAKLEKPAAAALLVNRAGWITDLLQHSLSHPEHPPIAEGLAVRDALRAAFTRCAVRSVEMDEKALPETASKALGLSHDQIEARLKELGAAAGRPWRKEQKLAALAAWLSSVDETTTLVE